TFTDLVMLDEGTGRLFNEKVLTTPDDPSRGVLQGISQILDKNGVAPAQVMRVIHGTTLVANALIERKGVATALVTTEGFRDIIEIGREWRYDTYDLFIGVVDPLVRRSRRFEVAERVGPDGAVLTPLTDAALEALVADLRDAPVEAIAVSLLHSFKNGEHERRVRDRLAAAFPDRTICISSEVMPEIGEYERTSTTIANAYVQPIFRRYIQRLSEGLKAMGIGRDLFLMQSDGGTVHQATAMEFPIRLVQSGPAGGVQATTLIGKLAGEADVLCFDMGGTTAKACLIEDGEPTRTTDFEVARMFRFKKGSGIPLKVPVVDMIEIGAGGGSIARVNRMGLIQVGPDSSSAVPGPACYGQGGEDATVTDADLLLGYLDAGNFLGGDMALDVDASAAAIKARIADPLGLSVTEAAWGIHETVNENMAQATGIHALEKGKRADRFVMVPIGGAGPVHACQVARKLRMRSVICPLGAGVASAFGFLASPMSFAFVQASVAALDDLDAATLADMFGGLEARGRELLSSAGVDPASFGVRILASMRYQGQGYEVDVPMPEGALDAGLQPKLKAAFEKAYGDLYGRIEAGMPVEVVSWRLIVASPYPDLKPQAADVQGGDIADALKGTRRIYDGEARDFVEAPVYDRYKLTEGMTADGPAIVEERESTLVVPAHSTIRIDRYRNLIVDFAYPDA
ncbi:MAG: hydantoinase/oxoprolinase family protein, partial [Alphaproteobacteria bacterium]|nr:hydantoinase/oxoprolinase family protein [Alphaproteobacteria bacterium]MDX5368366.1 hydantoinase/oxoprolinase family protein [Alphaproteobacteria bacterium]MDX5463161.1 hydantoinase/oxoprolinase family protein [Alphaproteobacteria bacterium]